MASAWGSSWGSAWGNAWGLISEDTESITASGSGGVAPYKRQHWSRRRFEDFLKLEASEPAIAKELESLATKAISSGEKLSAAQIQTRLGRVGIEYNRLHQSIYIGLVLELEKEQEQEQEFEAMAFCMAALL